MILFYFDKGSLGDSQRAMIALMSGLQAHGLAFRALLPSEDGDLAEALRARGVSVDVLTLPASIIRRDGAKSKLNFPALLSHLTYYRKLFRYFRMYEFQVVHSDGLRAHILSIGIKVRFNAPLIWNLWSILSVGWRLRLFRSAAAIFSDHLITSSLFVAHQLGRSLRWRQRLSVAYRGYDPLLFKPGAVSAGSSLVAIAGELIPATGYKTFLRALELARIEIPECRGLIITVGTGEQHESHRVALGAVVAQFRLSEAIRIDTLLTASVERGVAPALEREPIALYVNPDIELSPFNPDVVEAMGLGLPVVAARSGVLSELILNEATGMLTTAGDAQALAQVIVKLLRSSRLREELGAKGRLEFEARFGLRKYVETIEAVYRTVAPGLTVTMPESALISLKKAA